jgi:Cof subfamily protein (haloacid dehalogenase superfamily)
MEQPNANKIIITDLDGTLLNQDHQVSAYTNQILTSMHQQGHKLIVATGRHHLDAFPILSTLQIPFYLVTSNGARIHNQRNELIYQFNLNDATASTILNHPIDPEITAVLFKEEVWMTNKVNEKLNSFQKEMNYPPQIVDFSQVTDLSGIKILFTHSDNQKLEYLKQNLQLHFSDQFDFAFSLPICLELLHKQVDKSIAIEKILQIEKTNWNQTIAFGDGFNDEKMLLLAAKGLIMNNAPDNLKHKLSHLQIIQNNHEDGVAHYIEQNILS